MLPEQHAPVVGPLEALSRALYHVGSRTKSRPSADDSLSGPRNHPPMRLTQRLVPTRRAVPYLIPVVATLVLLAGGGFAALETDTVESYWEGVWWALSLTTTVGFAAGTPETALGKALSSLVMVLGFLLLALTTATLASLFVSEEQAPEELREHGFEEEALAEIRRLGARLDEIETRLPPRD